MHKSTLAVEASKFLEACLANLGGTGRGLGELAASLRGQLPAALRSELKAIADMRNEEVHRSSTWDEVEFLRKVLSVAVMLGDHRIVRQKPTTSTPKIPDQPAPEPAQQSEHIIQSAVLKPDVGLLEDIQVKRVLEANPPDVSEDELEDYIDDANARAHRARVVTSWRWDAFLYLVRSVDTDDDARLRHLQLALQSGFDIDRAVDIATEFLSRQFLWTRHLDLEACNAHGGEQKFSSSY